MSSSPVTDVSEDALARLNPAQREAVLHFEGPILVLAGAGSGKTRVLTTRIARLIEHHGVDPSHILAVTFTNKAAGEMRERIAKLVGEMPTGMWVGTFHAIGARMLRREAQLVGRSPSFTIYDEDDSLAAVRRIMERLGISTKTWSPKALRSAISGAKNALVSPEEYAKLAMDPLSKAASLVYDQWERTLRDANAVDFDDLLVLPVRVLQQNPDRVVAYRERFRFLLVDEYQDTNRAQYELVKLLAGADGNVLVVGDDDQSIYGWRGADIRNILDFERDFPAATVVRLEDNYRSTPQVLDLANAVISENTGRRGKTLRATLPPGDAVAQVATLDERDEAEFVAEEIVTLGSGPRALDYREIAVLYRTNSQSRALEESLRKRAIPYRLVGAVRFYDRREIRDLMSYLKLIANPADDEAFLRAVSVPRRGLGDATLESLATIARDAGRPMLEIASDSARLASLRPAARQALADFSSLILRQRDNAQDSSVDELLRNVIEEIRFADHLKAEGPEGMERIENVKELIAGASEIVADEGGELGLTPLDHFLQHASLITDVDRQNPNADAVTMMTLHNAKGLEFPAVFITGLEDGLFPLRRAQDTPNEMEEERRLFYVGITRAMRKLYLSHARSRRRNGETMQCIPSSFLKPIPPELVTQRASFKLRGSTRAVPTFSQSPSSRRPGQAVDRSWMDSEVDASQDAPRFAKGERVKHARFGSGTVTELSGVARDMKVTVAFDDETIGSKRLVVQYAGLERGFE
ncbi:MAG TPA: UvrD-helicase domain-containing protein [Gemmatimonadaceae bacterium]|nr:UvrD-helicase domain-containing protein [Gemmatimonadaceae bacterium]